MSFVPLPFPIIASASQKDEDIAGLPRPIAEALRPRDPSLPDSLFAAIPVPAKGDWLASQKEKGQTYADFGEAGNRVTPQQKKVYLAVIGDLEVNDPEQYAADLQEYASAFFLGLEVAFIKPISVGQLEGIVQSRVNFDTVQLNSKDIVKYLKKVKPDDAFCLQAVTNVDLYPAEGWNFVFGMGMSLFFL